MNPWQIAVAIIAGLVLLWVALVVTLYVAGRHHAERTRIRDGLRLLPDVVRLVRALLADPATPRAARIQLAALLVYLILPIDLVPDFVPVVGYADDAVLVALTLRAVTRRAGVEALRRHWPGTDAGLEAVLRLAGISETTGRGHSTH